MPIMADARTSVQDFLRRPGEKWSRGRLVHGACQHLIYVPGAASQSDQGRVRHGVEPLLQVDRRFIQHHFESRPDVSLEKVSAARTCVGQSDNGMGMNPWPLVFQRDVTDQRQCLDLRLDRDGP
jgi:hypothetical protein